MKKCTKCNIEKSLDSFYFNNQRQIPYPSCKLCTNSANRANHHSDKEKQYIRGKVYRDNNRESISARTNQWRRDNPENRRAIEKRYSSNNPGYLADKASRRRARKLDALPKWLSKEDVSKIKSIYKMSRNLSKKTKVQHHVDHIIPLQGKDVCGLHVPWNLQVITAKENLQKSNNILEDMI